MPIQNQMAQEAQDTIKASPRSKAKRPQQQQQQQQNILPESNIGVFGLPPAVMRCLEISETISNMRDLFAFSQGNPHLPPKAALNSLVMQLQQSQQIQAQNQQMQHAAQVAAANASQALQNQQGHPNGPNGPGQMHPSPHMNLVPGGMANSPSVSDARLGIPASPHVGHGQTPSPAQNHLQAPGLAQQHSQQQHPTSNPSSQTSTTVGSANTSPNQTNKRRRPSSSQNVKNEDDGDVGNPNQKVKQSPRGANKRTKVNPS